MKYGTIMERETREPGGLPSIYAEGLTLQTKEYPVGHRPGVPGGKKLSAAHSKVGKNEPGKAEKEPGPGIYRLDRKYLKYEGDTPHAAAFWSH